MAFLFFIPALATLAAGTATCIVFTSRAADLHRRRLDSWTETRAFLRAAGFALLGLCAAFTALHSLSG